MQLESFLIRLLLLNLSAFFSPPIDFHNLLTYPINLSANKAIIRKFIFFTRSPVGKLNNLIQSSLSLSQCRFIKETKREFNLKNASKMRSLLNVTLDQCGLLANQSKLIKQEMFLLENFRLKKADFEIGLVRVVTGKQFG